MRRNSLFAVLLCLSSGCAWITQNQAASDEYSRQVMVAAERAALLEAQVAALKSHITELDETVALQGKTESERLGTIEEVNDEIARLRGSIEELSFQVKELQTFLDSEAIPRERRMLHAEKRLSALEKFLNVRPPAPPTDEEMGLARTEGVVAVVDPLNPAITPITEPVTPVDAPKSAEDALELAISHMKEGRQTVARVILQKALEDYPEATERAEIYYRIGETQLNEQAWGPAIKAFNEVGKRYPKSSWAPWAMYRQAEAFDGKKDPENALLFYQSVVSQYPTSEAAAAAKKKLGK